MTRGDAFREQAWPDDPAFNELALRWAQSASGQILDWVWRAFDALRAGPMARVDFSEPLEQLERDLTDLHFMEIQRLWANETGGLATFSPNHEIPEFESRHSAQAQPPAYDLGFALYANPRMVWPIEAKVVRTPSAISEYLKDVRNKFLAGVAAPFIGQAAMIAYLLTGTAQEMFANLEIELPQTLLHPPAFAARDHRTSFHARGTSPFERELPDLLLHHLVMACIQGGNGQTAAQQN
jgi:hypothetical protein